MSSDETRTRNQNLHRYLRCNQELCRSSVHGSTSTVLLLPACCTSKHLRTKTARRISGKAAIAVHRSWTLGVRLEHKESKGGFRMAWGLGLEPRFSDSKSDVLPIRRPPNTEGK